ncbi:MAG: hypothetical protein QOJ16_3375 [Acidobacteriota bacterium]|nr:hypothetical protein [Acidobacteriota bacterium]
MDDARWRRLASALLLQPFQEDRFTMRRGANMSTLRPSFKQPQSFSA